MNVTGSYRKPLVEEGFIDSAGGPRMLKLRCDCGYEWEIEADAFPGRRRLKNCGRMGVCPYVPIPKLKKRPEDRVMSQSITLPISIVNQIAAFARKKDFNFSRACAELITAGLAHHLIDD